MKYFRFIRLIISFFAVFSVNVPRCQTSITYADSNEIARNSLIRMIDTSTGISYKYGNDKRSFNYVDFSTLVELRTQIPLNYSVEDYVIQGNDVYFCGYNASTNRAFIGHTMVNSIMNGIGAYRLIDIGTTNGGAILYNLYKCDIFSVYDCTYFVAVGATNNGRCVIEMRNINSTYSIQGAIDTSKTEVYSDIAVTDNHIVAAGHDASSHQVLRLFSKPYVPNVSLFATSIGMNIATYNSYYTPSFASGTLMSNISNDVFVTVSFGFGNSNPDIIFSAYDCGSGLLTSLSRMMIPYNYKCMNNFYDLVYKRESESLYLSVTDCFYALLYEVNYSQSFSYICTKYDLNANCFTRLDRNPEVMPLAMSSFFNPSTEHQYHRMYNNSLPNNCMHQSNVS